MSIEPPNDSLRESHPSPRPSGGCGARPLPGSEPPNDSGGYRGGHFDGDRHALYVGWVLGIAMKNGVHLQPVVDAEGNYTDRLTLDLYDPSRRPVGVTITFVVPPPPDDWTSPMPRCGGNTGSSIIDWFGVDDA